MSKRVWIWIVFIALFPPLVLVPMIQYLFYFPVRDGVIGGSRIRFYFWGLSITGLSAIAAIPISLDKKLDFIKIYKYLGTPSNATTYIILSFLIGILSIFLFYYSTRNEPEQKQFLPVRKFTLISYFSSVWPYLFFLTLHFSRLRHYRWTISFTLLLMLLVWPSSARAICQLY